MNKQMKKRHIVYLTLFCLTFYLFNFFFKLITFAQTPATKKDAQIIEKQISIPFGATLSNIANNLYKKKIINNIYKFKLLAYIKGKAKKIEAGEYLIDSSMTPVQILDELISKNAILYKVTIPEGYNIKQIAEILEKKKIITQKEFLFWAQNEEFQKRFFIKAKSFEGYLFPETYLFPKKIGAKEIINKMFNCFQKRIEPNWKKRAKELNFSFHQIVTLASIIEKEASKEEEKKIISSVFHNRLKKRMRLEADPTVIYGIKNFDGNIKKKHLQKKHSYNTYKIKGLPPGPIANPGYSSIEAALYPAKTNNIFFVSKKDGWHKFSTNIKDHNKAVYKYQIKR